MYGAIIGALTGLSFSPCNPAEADFPLLNPEHPSNALLPHYLWPAVIVAAAIGKVDRPKPESELDEEIFERAKALAYRWASPPSDADVIALIRFECYTVKLLPQRSGVPSTAMTVASVAGWFCDDLDETRFMARRIARIFAEHTDELKFAEVTASAVFLARTGSSKDDIYGYLCDSFPFYFVEEEVPSKRRYYNRELVVDAVTCFLKSTSFEDALRICEYSGGTMGNRTAIVGAIAEAYYGIPDNLMELFSDYLIQTPLHKKCATALAQMRKPRQPRNPATAECPT